MFTYAAEHAQILMHLELETASHAEDDALYQAVSEPQKCMSGAALPGQIETRMTVTKQLVCSPLTAQVFNYMLLCVCDLAVRQLNTAHTV